MTPKTRRIGKKNQPPPPKPQPQKEEEDAPEMEPVDDDDDDDDESGSSDYDEDASDSNDDPQVSDDDYDDDDDDDTEEDEFEEQGSSDDDDDDALTNEDDDDDDDDEEVEILNDADLIMNAALDAPRAWPKMRSVMKRGVNGRNKLSTVKTNTNQSITAGDEEHVADDAAADDVSQWMHADDLSSDDEDDEGLSNRIGRIPLHWYDEYSHIGYDVHGKQVIKSNSSSKDLLDQALDANDQQQQLLDSKDNNKFTVYDALNAKDVTLTPRQIELLRRVQSGAFAHPEFNAHPDSIDYYSGVDPMISGLNSNRYLPKANFQPSKYEKLQVRRLLHRLKCGSINMDFLEGKVRDMNDLIQRPDGRGENNDNNKPFLLWRGDEEDELALRKGPQHMPAPKVPPPGHAYSYNPPPEYLPNEEELAEWKTLDPIDRPYGLFIPRKFDNLRSVGAYEHSVQERFERCLDLYLCPRSMKRRLNIDPESLVPQLPKASDLRPFPTTKAIQYVDPSSGGGGGDQEGVGVGVVIPVRCLSVSPDGQFLVSGSEDGLVRLWEVHSGRMLRKWDLSEVGGVNDVVAGDDDNKGGGEDDTITAKTTTRPIASLEWNPNRTHHCILAAVGKCAVVIATGTGGLEDSEITEALLSAASSCKDGSPGGNIAPESRAAKAVTWTTSAVLTKDKKSKKSTTTTTNTTPVSAFGIGKSGPIAVLRTNSDVASVKWHRKGDYFVTVSPKAGAAAVLIHQLSKAASQQPFGKSKGGEAQLACFHPHKPFLFVATKEHIRVYHLVKQMMVKRLLSGCRHISSLDVHTSGDHVIVGSLDRRLVWFDLDLANTPYKTLKYHERALRSVGYHPRYPLMASASDDGSIHVFHSMVYSDLMRNPLIVPVKVLRGHSVTKQSLGALSMVFHPTQPWLFSAGADGNIHMFQDMF